VKVYNVQHELMGAFTVQRTKDAYITVHHAAALYPQATGIEDVRAVATYHTKTKGWGGIGYHIALAEDVQGGPIARYNLSPLTLQRAHVALRNHEAIGVCCLTNFDKHPGGMPEQKWLDALVEVLRELKASYPRAAIVGHREIALKGYETACPGATWSQWKPQLLALVNQGGTVKDVEVFPQPRRYRVTNEAGGNVRNQPSTSAPVKVALPAGVAFDADKIVEGAALSSGKTWLHVPGLGYLHMSIVAPEPTPIAPPDLAEVRRALKELQEHLQGAQIAASTAQLAAQLES
jgi:hypothetical protein